MKLSKKTLKKLLPNLTREVQDNNAKITINSIRTEISESKTTNLTGQNPDIVDFLRRCDTEREGEEIIDFMETRGEISHNYANNLRQQLKVKGIRSFGPKKAVNYYFMRQQ